MSLVHAYFYSETLGMDVSCEVVVPDPPKDKKGAEPARRTGTKVLWLLHGGGDDQTMWQRHTSIERYVGPLGIAVVMPFAGFSGYRNQPHGSGRYFDYITLELPLVMNSLFGFSLACEDNYVAGQSMGCNGALMCGMMYPEKYSAIGAFSGGAFDNNLPRDLDTMHIDPERDLENYVRYDKRVIEGAEFDILENARKLALKGTSPLPRIYHTTGEKDHVIWSAYRTRDFFQGLEGNPFGYVYEEYPGSHNWAYWDLHIQKFLKFVQDI